MCWTWERGDNDDLTTTFGRYDPEHDLQPPSPRTAQRAFDSYRPKDRPPCEERVPRWIPDRLRNPA